MKISQVIQRLQELQNIESDIDVVLQDVHGDAMYNYYLDVHVDINNIHTIMFCNDDDIEVDVPVQGSRPVRRSRR